MDICGEITFTGEDITDAMDKIFTDNEPFFEILAELGQATKLTIASKPIEANDATELVSSCLFTKSINTCEAIIRVCRAGCVSEAKALIRVLLEAAVILSFIEKDSANLQKYIDASKHEKIKRLQNIIKYPEYLGDLIADNEIEHLIALRKQIHTEIQNNKIAKKNIREWAAVAGMLETYIIAYDLFSEDVHIDPTALERYILKDENDNISKIDVRSVDLLDLRHVLFTCFDIFSKILLAYISIRRLDCTHFDDVMKKRSKFGPALI